MTSSRPGRERQKPTYNGRFREGAKDHCFWCGFHRKEHKKGECPDYSLRGKNGKGAFTARGNKKVRGGVWFES